MAWNAIAGNAPSASLVSCMHRMSGCTVVTQSSTLGRRAFNEFTFQVATRSMSGPYRRGVAFLTVEIETGSGLRFRARTSGDSSGRPIILLHGFPQTSRCFAAQLEPLAAAGCYAVAFDQRGYSPGARPDD